MALAATAKDLTNIFQLGTKLTIGNATTAKEIVQYIQAGGAITPRIQIVNDLGFGAELHRAERVSEAINDPKAYVDARTAKIADIAKGAAEHFEEEQAKLLGIGLPTDQAKAIAYAAAKSYADIQKAYLNANYPSDVLERAVDAYSADKNAVKGAKARILAP